MIGHAFEAGPRRARAWAFWGSAIGVAITLGPVVGGVITSYFGWRWSFLINVPLCLLFFAATLAFVPESSDPETARPDTLGFLTFTISLSLMTWALIDANGPRPSWTLARAAVALAVFFVFLGVERRHPRPLMDVALFQNRTFLGGTFAMVGYAAGAQVLLFYLPLYLQKHLRPHAPPRRARMLPFALPLFIVPRVAGWLALRMSSRSLLALGLGVAVLGNLLLALASPMLSYPLFAVAMTVAGCGAGLLNGETAKVMTSSTTAERAGMASGIATTTRFTGLLVAISALGAVLARVTSTSFALPGIAPRRRLPRQARHRWRRTRRRRQRARSASRSGRRRRAPRLRHRFLKRPPSFAPESRWPPSSWSSP